MTPNTEILKKITGDIADEVPEATYRLGASLLVRAVLDRGRKQLGDSHPAVKFFREQLGEQAAEALVGFLLAAALELVPTQGLSDTRKRLAYNLRVRSYEELGEHLLLFTGFINEEVERAIHLAGQPPATIPT
ncbi:MAG: hypothetical protein ND866_12540 [Pyrinomonadaceae bacterium]|nr:hypothetical protein [Pyrinomonadaceae bacterium]